MNDINWCIEYLKNINNVKQDIRMPNQELFRALENITMPINLSDEFYLRQDKVLQEILSFKQIINAKDLFIDNERITLYEGDITLIKASAIVNACNNKLLGCFVPGHHCIDNAIHSFAGLQVRRDLMKIMEEQGYDEPSGKCKVTLGYNLPSSYIFHTVGPIYSNTEQDEIDLKNCYLSCLKEAYNMKLETIVFCAISTGIYGFPFEKAANIAIKTVKDFLKEHQNIKVVFNLFNHDNYLIYKKILEK